MTTLRESRPPLLGRQHSYKLVPAPAPGCEVRWLIDGEDVTVDSEVGGLEVKGIGASGEITVEVTDDTSDTSVTAVITCGANREVVGPMLVGTGEWTPPPPGAGVPLNPDDVVLQVSKWSWWDRISGHCPDSWWIDGVNCTCAQQPDTSGAWPLLYEITCTFNCPPLRITTLTWTLSFGVILSGPR